MSQSTPHSSITTWLDSANSDSGVQEMLRMRATIESSAIAPVTLGELVRSKAQSMGNSLLCTWFEDDVTLSYAGLDEAADRLASSLLTMGVRKGTHVAVMLPNVAAFPITLVALGRIGAIMIPVNTGYSSEEMHFVLSDGDAQYLIIDALFLPILKSMPVRPPLIADSRVIVHGDAEQSEFDRWQELARDGVAHFIAPSSVVATDLLSLQYTSGTTGFPKGCLLTHDYWMLLSRSAAEMRGSGGDVKNVLIWAPFFYMDPQWQFWMTLWLEGSVFIARRMSLTQFHEWLRKYQIHMCIYPEPALKQPASEELVAGLSLKYLSIYGWGADARAEVERRFGVVAREGYGMTEIGGGTIVPPSAVHMAHQLTCGLAAPYRDLRIVDADERDVGAGEVGELWVAGRGILWGYYKRPEANAECFRGKWFRTGDLFKRDENGYFYIVGRLKDMIKRSGENIAAIEVEAALRAMPEIEEAAVVPVPDSLRREEVKAYLKLREGLSREEVTPEMVFAHCKVRLAAFKIPRYLAYMDTDFPRTPTRKIVKRALIDGVADLRVGAFDRVDGIWRS